MHVTLTTHVSGKILSTINVGGEDAVIFIEPFPFVRLKLKLPHRLNRGYQK